MGVLIDGVWRDAELPQETAKSGEFKRADSRFRDRVTQHHPQFESRPLPREPHQLVPIGTIKLPQLLRAVRRRRERNAPIRMKVIHVKKWKKTMKRCID